MTSHVAEELDTRVYLRNQMYANLARKIGDADAAELLSPVRFDLEKEAKVRRIIMREFPYLACEGLGPVRRWLRETWWKTGFARRYNRELPRMISRDAILRQFAEVEIKSYRNGDI